MEFLPTEKWFIHLCDNCEASPLVAILDVGGGI